MMKYIKISDLLSAKPNDYEWQKRRLPELHRKLKDYQDKANLVQLEIERINNLKPPKND